MDIYSNTDQPNAPALAAKTVFTKASIAILSNVNALPTLKPYQPNHTKIPPIKVMTKLCGGRLSTLCPALIITANTKPETPDVMCTTVPPA